jgi:hypothetical protein
MATCDCVSHLLTIERRHKVQNVVRLCGGVLLHRSRRVLDEIGKGRVSRQGWRDPPPDPILLRRRRDTGICAMSAGGCQLACGPAAIREAGWAGPRGRVLEHARSRLRNEMHRSSEPVVQSGQRRSWPRNPFPLATSSIRKHFQERVRVGRVVHLTPSFGSVSKSARMYHIGS